MVKSQRIAEQVKNNIITKKLISLEKKTASHSAPGAGAYKRHTNKINIKDLTNVIEIDTEKQICVAEAGITFSDLVQVTLQKNFIPRCVPELKGITIGGAVSGFSLESMSYKHGAFHDSCLEYRVVTGNGDIITCSNSENEDIFNMLHCSFGTLGIITEVTFELVPAKPFVKLEYQKFNNIDEYLNEMDSHFQKQDIDFIDGIIHSPQHFVLCLGTFIESVPYTSSVHTQAFYKGTRKNDYDFFTTYDYLFRYDHDCHWVTRRFGLENVLLRKMFGKLLLGSKNLINLSNRFSFFLMPKEKPDVITDIFIPYSNSREFYSWYLDHFNYFPIWVVPFKKDSGRYPWMNPAYMQDVEDTLYIDFAIYGFQQPRGPVNYYRLLEAKVSELRGFKALISPNYYSEQEFWDVFNRDKYVEIKNKIDPHSIFPDIYIKLHEKY